MEALRTPPFPARLDFDEGDDIVHASVKIEGSCNQLVVGSNPTSRAKQKNVCKGVFLFLNIDFFSLEPYTSVNY